MKINNLSSQHFGICTINVPPAYYQQIPAIIRHADAGKIQSAVYQISQIPRLQKVPVPKRNPHSDIFIYHEAILPDNKVRIIGFNKKASQSPIQTKNLKGAGRKNYQKIWSKR